MNRKIGGFMHDDDKQWSEINDHFHQTWAIIGFTGLGLLIMIIVAAIVQLTIFDPDTNSNLDSETNCKEDSIEHYHP